MSKIWGSILLLIFVFSCTKKETTSQENEEETFETKYVVNKDFEQGDARRYGVVPNEPIGQHPNLKIDKLKALVELAEQGVEITFPEGTYDRSFVIDSASNVKFNFENATFTGSFKILNSKSISLKGNLTSFIEFYTKNVDDINAGVIRIKNDTNNGKKMLGFQIHSLSKNVMVDSVFVQGISTTDEDIYNKAGLIIHGHNAEPSNITIKYAEVASSGRNGAYVTGNNIIIDKLEVSNYGTGSSAKMKPMEGTHQEESKDMSGLWVRNCNSCEIGEVIIDTPNNTNASYSVRLDVGDELRPSVISVLETKGKKLEVNKIERSNTEITQVK